MQRIQHWRRTDQGMQATLLRLIKDSLAPMLRHQSQLRAELGMAGIRGLRTRIPDQKRRLRTTGVDPPLKRASQ